MEAGQGGGKGWQMAETGKGEGPPTLTCPPHFTCPSIGPTQTAGSEQAWPTPGRRPWQL